MNIWDKSTLGDHFDLCPDGLGDLCSHGEVCPYDLSTENDLSIF